VTSGGYRNPVIPGFHPDPSVCRWGDEYVLAVSSFTYFPGVPIFTSTDLVDWTQVGNALDRPTQLELEPTRSSSRGVYAPTVRAHDGRLWMITTVLRDTDLVNFLVTADEPAGPWSEPVRVDIAGIDPDLSWDDEENCWVHFSALGIRRARIDDRSGAVLDDPELTWSGTGLHAPEAPHLIRRNDWWYLLIAEGGTERGHGVSIARGPSPVGPWEACPANPILSHRSRNHPIQNTGHADLVEATDGSWWMVLLGTRPRGMTPGFHVLGRETFLVPVDWVDGWPVPYDLELEMPTRPSGAARPTPAPTRDDFDEPSLGPAYVSLRRPLGDAAALTERPGWLTLHGSDDGLDDALPVFVARRQPTHWCRARTAIEVGDATEAGLAVRMDEGAHYEVAVAAGEVIVRARIGPLASIVARATAPASPFVLRLETHDPAGRSDAPDLVQLGFEEADGSFVVLAELDGRYLSTEVATGFIGRVVGLYAVGGSASFDWFELDDL
jgi:xylan 1,4-beta-xylosidase